MSWKCSLLGHSYSQWLEDKENNRQERWCKRCQFLEISALVKPYKPDCHKGLHIFGKWQTDPVWKYTKQARWCVDCQIKDSRRI